MFFLIIQRTPGDESSKAFSFLLLIFSPHEHLLIPPLHVPSSARCTQQWNTLLSSLTSPLVGVVVQHVLLVTLKTYTGVSVDGCDLTTLFYVFRRIFNKSDKRLWWQVFRDFVQYQEKWTFVFTWSKKNCTFWHFAGKAELDGEGGDVWDHQCSDWKKTSWTGRSSECNEEEGKRSFQEGKGREGGGGY